MRVNETLWLIEKCTETHDFLHLGGLMKRYRLPPNIILNSRQREMKKGGGRRVGPARTPV